MFTTGAKYLYGLTVGIFVTAVAYGYTTGGDGLGPVTAGYYGGVGDHLGYTVLLFTAVVSLFLGLTASAFRDADPEAEAEVAGTEAPPAVAPASVSYWPAVAGFGLGVTVLGLVISNVVFVIGLVVLGAVMVEWLVLAWSERATGDPETNRAIRRRMMYPFEIPIVGALVILVLVVSISRVLLAVSALGAVAVAGVIAALILAVGALVATRPRLSPNVIAALLVVGAIGVLAAGVIGASVGERDFEHHGDEEHSQQPEGDDVDEQGLTPMTTEAGS